MITVFLATPFVRSFSNTGNINFTRELKICYSEMFLGPAHKDFKFVPKHKSNSYEIEAEG